MNGRRAQSGLNTLRGAISLKDVLAIITVLLTLVSTASAAVYVYVESRVAVVEKEQDSWRFTHLQVPHEGVPEALAKLDAAMDEVDKLNAKLDRLEENQQRIQRAVVALVLHAGIDLRQAGLDR